MIWIVSADSNDCRIYAYIKKPPSLKLLKELSHPEFKRSKKEFLTTDKPGHYQPQGTIGGAFEPHTDPKETAIIHFAKDIAHYLEQGRKTGAYDKLILVSPPHMNGLIYQNLDKHTQHLLLATIKKDLIHLPEESLLQSIQDSIKGALING